MFHTQGLKTLDDNRAFLHGSEPLALKAPQREAAYELIAHTMRRFLYTPAAKQPTRVCSGATWPRLLDSRAGS